MKYSRTDEEFKSDLIFGRMTPKDVITAVRNDTIQAVFNALLVTKQTTKIQTETHNITITVRKRRNK